jgi:hypothetical protein
MIDSYDFGKIIVEGKQYTHDIIIFSDHVKADWWRKESHNVYLEDLEDVFKHKVKTLIIGTGHDGMMQVSSEVFNYCTSNNVKLLALPTKEAVKLYNKLYLEEGVVAALHLTC